MSAPDHNGWQAWIDMDGDLFTRNLVKVMIIQRFATGITFLYRRDPADPYPAMWTRQDNGSQFGVQDPDEPTPDPFWVHRDALPALYVELRRHFGDVEGKDYKRLLEDHQYVKSELSIAQKQIRDMAQQLLDAGIKKQEPPRRG